MDHLNIPIREVLNPIHTNSASEAVNTLHNVNEEEIIRSLCVDSRKLKKNDWFICIKGETHDGHQFIRQALEDGAAGIIYSEIPANVAESLPQDFRGIKVADTTDFLGKLGAYWRQAVNPFVIAVTGSNGKTSVKELLAFLLENCHEGNVRKSSGNFNNQFGVPYTLLSLQANDRFLIVEMGTNHPGEIAALSKLAKPDVAVITSVSPGHIGHFGSLDAIIEEKSDIITGLKTGGTLFLQADLSQNPVIQNKAKQYGISIKTPQDDLTLKSTGENGSEFLYRDKTLTFSLCGLHQFQNLNLAYTTVKNTVNKPEKTSRALQNIGAFLAVKGRLAKKEIQGYFIWDDSYNANPDSFDQAVSFFKQTILKNGPSKIFGAFGMMGELGDFSENAHENLGQSAAQAGFSLVFFSSPEENIRRAFLRGWQTAAAPEQVYLAANSDNEIEKGRQFLLSQMKKGDHLLIKGSRSTKMERLIPLFESNL